MADGAVHIDTTAYTLDEVIDQVVALVEAVGGARVTDLRDHDRAPAQRPGPAPAPRSCSHPLRPLARWS